MQFLFLLWCSVYNPTTTLWTAPRPTFLGLGTTVLSKFRSWVPVVVFFQIFPLTLHVFSEYINHLLSFL